MNICAKHEPKQWLGFPSKVKQQAALDASGSCPWDSA